MAGEEGPVPPQQSQGHNGVSAGIENGLMLEAHEDGLRHANWRGVPGREGEYLEQEIVEDEEEEGVIQ